jgi:hypothetical protein
MNCKIRFMIVENRVFYCKNNQNLEFAGHLFTPTCGLFKTVNIIVKIATIQVTNFVSRASNKMVRHK